MSRDPDPPRDRFVPTVGFVIAGFGVASGFLEWTDAVAVGQIPSLPGVLVSLIALVAFGARRYGAEDRRYSILAGFGTGSLAWVSVVAFLFPVVSGTPDVPIGIGIPVAFVLGAMGLGVAYADYVGIERQGLLRRSRFSSAALGIGLVGLFVGFLVAAGTGSLIPGSDSIVRSGLSTAGFSIGLGVVALGFLAVTDNDWSFIDVAWPDRRGWAYVVVGVVAMFAILFLFSLLANTLGLPSTSHGVIEEARKNPMVLLPSIPLSILAIGPGEELLNRNIIQKYLYGAFSRPTAILIATIIFTLIHIPAYATGSAAAVFTTLVRLFGISLVLGVVYERTDNVVVSALVHGTYDAIQFGLAYVALTSGII